jgi:hypothetical protein
MGPYNGFSGAQRARAERWINREINAGRLVWPTACVICGRTDCLYQFHAEDYGEPFGPHVVQFGVCIRCHQWIHRREAKPVGYAAYVDEVTSEARPGSNPSLLVRIEAGEFDPTRRRSTAS